MFISYNDKSIDFIGRWSEYENTMTATAPGSSIKIAFKGDSIVLHFDMLKNAHPYPHLWLTLDGKNKFETTCEAFIRIEAENDGEHILTVIFKSAVEMQHRWYWPLTGKVSFKGYEAKSNATLPADTKKTIEFVGDSITEGVLVDDERNVDLTDGMNNRPFQDDSTATYAYLTAKALGLRSLHFAYGAVGLTKMGCGGVPKASVSYPYCFDSHKVNYPSPDYILINHGANDRGNGVKKYLEEYKNILDMIREINPTSKIISLSAFCGAYHEELGEFIASYNKENKTDILFIDSNGWVPVEPLHPLRDGHKIIAEKLTAILKRELNL